MPAVDPDLGRLLLEASRQVGADLVADLHSGGSSLMYVPSALAKYTGDKKRDAKIKALLEAFAAPISYVTTALGENRTSTAAAERAGTTIIGTELGGKGTVDIDGTKVKGVVEGFSVRSIRLRHQNGQLHIVPFGQVGHITNFSRDWTVLKFNLAFAPGTDVELLRKTVKKIGVDHVGISSDFDGGGGVDGFNSAAEAFNVTLELVRRGYTEQQIGKMWSGNLLRVMDECQKIGGQLQSAAR